MKSLGQETVRLIVERTQEQGRGVSGGFGGRKKKLKKLAESTIKRRNGLKKLSSKTSPDTSNLTMTGKLIQSVTSRVKGFSRVLIYIKGSRNKTVAEHVQTDRPFLLLTKTETNTLLKFFKRLIRSK